MNVTGKIKVINETQTYGEKGFRKREFVITTFDQYPQDILIETVQDKCDLLDKFKIGDSVDVAINIRGRSWTSPQGEEKYFNSIQGWRIAQSNGQQGGFEPAQTVVNNEPDDLPF